jgi:cellulose synthase/poly-beta-1,6-N-acetylglucosamine synthase-like glycosyltransferase
MSYLTVLLICALVLSALAVGSLFVGEPRRPALAPGTRAALAATGAGLATLGLSAVLGATAVVAVSAALLLGVAVLVNARVAAPWTTRGLLAWSLTLAAFLAYLVYVAHWLVVTDLGPAARTGASLLWFLELFVFVLSMGYLWELVDVLARWDWARRVTLRHEVEEAAHTANPRTPFVSLHVPTHNEPPDLVIATLQTLLDLEYDDYEVLVLDNNTDDPALWHPVAEFCERHPRLRFFHLSDWPGFKSGALNFGLTETDPRAELVGVVDADYQVRPDFLRRCAPLFSDPVLGFVQTPQDYRDWQTDSYFRRLYYSYSYFFDVSQRSRNERDGAIFGGTMGLIRRSALVEVGGWDEWCITEDAELSLRLLQAGWHGSHIEESFGEGIMPLTFEALKRQRFRWCFGGVQILRMHWRSLLPGRRTPENQMGPGQRWAYLVGALQWFGDLAGLCFTAFLLLGSFDALLGSGLVIRRLSGVLLVCVVGLVFLGALRSVALVHRASGARWRDAFGAFGLWLALGWVVALGSVRGLVAREGAFLRTPKFKGEVRLREALRGNLVEVALVAACLTGVAAGIGARSAGGAVVSVLLLTQAAGHAMAPYNSLAAIRADLTPELRRRRNEKRLSWTRVSPGLRRWGIGPVIAATLGAALLFMVAAPVGGPAVGLLPDQSDAPSPGQVLDPVVERRSPAERATGSATADASVTAGSTPPTSRAATTRPPRTTATQRAAGASATATATATRPAAQPTARATGRPSAQPANGPTAAPTNRATARPTDPGNARPTTGPTRTAPGKPTP